VDEWSEAAALCGPDPALEAGYVFPATEWTTSERAMAVVEAFNVKIGLGISSYAAESRLRHTLISASSEIIG